MMKEHSRNLKERDIEIRYLQDPLNSLQPILSLLGPVLKVTLNSVGASEAPDQPRAKSLGKV